MTLTVDDLQALIEHLDWDDFQRTEHGVIYVYVPYVRDKAESLIRYSYRVGLHFKRPMEAIMAKGEYIRMQAAPQYEFSGPLGRLDPENVDGCLYTGFKNGIMLSGWRPQEPAPAQSQFQPGTVYAGSTLVGQGYVPPWSNTVTGIGSSYPSDNFYYLNAVQAQQAQERVTGGLFGTLSSAMQGLGDLLGKA